VVFGLTAELPISELANQREQESKIPDGSGTKNFMCLLLWSFAVLSSTSDVKATCSNLSCIFSTFLLINFLMEGMVAELMLIDVVEMKLMIDFWLNLKLLELVRLSIARIETL